MYLFYLSSLTFLLVGWSVCGSSISSDIVPLVIWPGMGDSCCYVFGAEGYRGIIETILPDIYVRLVAFGKTPQEDTYNSFFLNANTQVELACQLLSSDPKLKDGFNAMGFSQGSQLLRALVQRCPSIRVYNLISVGGQHHGVYGFPFCMADQSIFCDLFRHFLSIGVYLLFIQEILVQAEYWHDPFYEESYKLDCIFLPDINQEVKFNPLYKERLSNVSNFVLIKFEQDRMVQPIETQWFGFYKPGQAMETYSLFDSRLYKQDLLGLKYLNDTGRLHLLSSPNGHTLLTYKWLKLFVIPFINVTYNDSHKPITLKTDPYLTYRKLITNPSAPSCITYNSQNISIYGQNDGSIYRYDQEGNLINHHINVLPEHIRATSISAYNTTLYMAGNDNKLYLYSAITNQINRTQYFSYNSINGISIHDGLIYISKYRSIDVLDNNGGRLTTSLSLENDSNPSKVQIDSNGNIRVIDCDTGIIHVLSKGGKELLHEYSTISMYPVALAVDDDDNMIVCDGDGYVYVYDSNGQLMRKIDGFHTCTDVLYIDGTLWITDVIDSKIYLF